LLKNKENRLKKMSEEKEKYGRKRITQQETKKERKKRSFKQTLKVVTLQNCIREVVRSNLYWAPGILDDIFSVILSVP
jgi:hypothetical protein